MKKRERKASEKEGNQKQARYSEEFKQQLVDLVRGGRNPEELGRQFEPSAQAIRNWVAQAEREDGKRKDGLTNSEREELRRLQRENARLREEREILSKAAAWFAQETQKTPNGSSRS
jgi:transposase